MFHSNLEGLILIRKQPAEVTLAAKSFIFKIYKKTLPGKKICFDFSSNFCQYFLPRVCLRLRIQSSVGHNFSFLRKRKIRRRKREGTRERREERERERREGKLLCDPLFLT